MRRTSNIAPSLIICPLHLAVKPDAMTIKDLGRWESIEMVQRYTRPACRASLHIMSECDLCSHRGLALNILACLFDSLGGDLARGPN